MDKIQELFLAFGYTQEDFDKWLDESNKFFGGVTPRALIEGGKAETVESALIAYYHW